MQRYFFHVIGGSRIYRDDEGVKLSDLEAARDYALQDARDLVCQSPEDVQYPADWTIQVCDQTGQELLAVPFSDAVRGNAGKPQSGAD